MSGILVDGGKYENDYHHQFGSHISDSSLCPFQRERFTCFILCHLLICGFQNLLHLQVYYLLPLYANSLFSLPVQMATNRMPLLNLDHHRVHPGTNVHSRGAA